MDVATGATAHAAILEALIRRGITGEGSDIRISMFDVMADWLAVPLLCHEGGKSPKRVGLAHPSIAPYGVFTTKDGKPLLISIQSEREWVKLCSDVLLRSELPKDARFASNVSRVANRSETDGIVAEVFGALDEAELRQRLIAADIAFAAVNDMEGLASHPHLRRIEVETPNGPVAVPAPAPIVTEEPRRYGRVPAIGETPA